MPKGENARRLLWIGHVAGNVKCILPPRSSPIGVPLARSLKRAIVFAGVEGHVPRDHARRLISILGLEGA
jgi:hypothetical protein